MAKGYVSLTGKFMAYTGIILLALMAGIYAVEWHEINKDAEAQLLDKGNSLAVALSKTLQSVTEDDIRNGVVLRNGTRLTGEELKSRLFNDKLTVMPESQQEAQKRSKDPAYAEGKQLLFDGRSVPLAQYELKYTSAFDEYTDDRWQAVIDSFLTDDNVIFAIPSMYSDHPDFVGYTATHNSKYSPQGEASKDSWGAAGLLSQKYRGNRVFNDETGYRSAATKDTSKALLQKYPRNLEGKIVETWNISYPLTIEGKHWGGVRVALSKEGSDALVAKQRMLMGGAFGLLYAGMLLLLFVLSRLIVARKLRFVLRATANLNSHEADLTYRIPVKGKDEMGQLAEEVNRFIAHLQGIIGTVHGMSGRIGDISGKLTESAAQSTVMASDISRTVREMAAGAENQASGAEDSAKAMEEMAGGIQRIAEASSHVTEATKRLVEEADQGSRSSEKAMEQMGTMNESARKVAEAIHKLEEGMQVVGEMAHVISGIASQTGLLALNAAIEAARAGEHGKGFAVVAGEVRKLADQSEASAGQIHEMVEGIQATMKAAVLAMQQGGKDVELGVFQVEEVRRVLGSMVGMIHSISGQMEEVSAAAEQMTAGTEEVTAGIEEMARIAGSASENAHQVAEASQRQLQESEETRALSDALRSAERQLSETVGRFRF
ncbi:methyl-accepting chemotaxis protein [Paenibacillus sp. OAS669]|uniref:methyl-accepting chemotaxis protein n=1 Tax=Paenibacillus sp. OAS669 TaxID=2663821 RepID=UPI00178B8C83|nr:methyl-accepting chemotaxis protein [Paenibacillus sp. OAS669]MBE1443597.1 methyl-accepting chemotaxis protein [Paenibacillus sp. OAS669]